MNELRRIMFAFLIVLTLRLAAARGAEPLWLDPRATALPTDQIGPFVKLGDDRLLCVKDDAALISSDDGRTWESHPIFGGAKLKARPEQGLLRTRDGTIVFVFMDDLDKHWKWNAATNSADGKVWLNVWAVRSTDDGKTWTNLQKIQDGYCGAIRDIIETEKGNLVVPVQRFLPEQARHATVGYVSPDKGVSWKETTLLDAGGRGHHDGSIEACLVQLKDQRLWMLLRTSRDYFWQAFSKDDGQSWEDLGSTKIDASSSPGMLKRLASGRLMLAWNRLYLDGQNSIARRGGQHSATEASWQREELAVALSDDDGKTWGKPIIIARQKPRLAYPYLLERRPGEIWITTMQGELRIKLNEADLIAPPEQGHSLNLSKVRGEGAGGAALDVGADGAFDAQWTAAPGVLCMGAKYRMWYSSCFSSSSRERRGGIGVAESSDGVHWVRENNGKPVFEVGAQPTLQTGGCASDLRRPRSVTDKPAWSSECC